MSLHTARCSSIHSRIHIDDTGLVRCPGVDMGGKATVHYRNRSHLVLKVAGHTGWAFVGAQAYYPARFIVLGIEGSKRGTYMGRSGEMLTTHDIIDFPLRPEVEPLKKRRR